MGANDPMDAILQQQCPTIMVPKYGAFEALRENGRRILAAADGLWLEVRRPWLYLRQQIAAEEYGVTLPYGSVTPALETVWDGSRHMESLVDRFIQEAERASPTEHAAWLVWNEHVGMLDYCPCIAISSGSGHIQYHRPRCEEHEHPCIDIHSHGAAPAFFSDTDDADDAGEVEFAIVVGDLNSDRISIRTRICAHGMFIEPDGAEA